MDKVQFNNEVVNMRKVVKRVKVLTVHSLTRQVAKLRKKKGSEQQTLKNQRRADRFLAEIEAIKDLQADLLTKKAVTFKKTLQEVVNNPKSSAEDRVLARVIHHKLIQDRISKFKELVTKDLLRTGTKKYRRLRKEQFEAEADARLKEEEVYQDTLEKTVTADKIDEHDDDYHSDDDDEGDDDEDDDEDDEETFKQMMRVDRIDQDTDKKNDDDAVVSESMNYSEDRMGGVEDGPVRGGKSQESHKKLDREQFQTLMPHSQDKSHSEQSTQKAQDTRVSVTSRADVSDVPPSRVTGKKKLDSMFLGSLSNLHDDDINEILRKTRREQLERKAKTQKMQTHQPKAEPSQGTEDSPIRTKHKIPMVDQPNPVRRTSGEKLIPGINCHPDLPPRQSQRDTHEKRSRKPFPGRPQSKHLPARQPQHHQHHHMQPSDPTAATILSPKKPAAKQSLHPSWEASRKRKEASKIVPFQGKKITFDDD